MKKGSILVVILWMVSILSMLAVSVTVLSSSQISFARSYRNRVAQYYLARAGIIMGYAELERDKTLSPGFDALKEEWSNKAELFSERNLGIGSFSVGYEYASGLKVYNTMAGEQPITSSFSGLIDEERKININTAEQIVLQNLFQQIANLPVEQALALAASVKDWTDADATPRQGGGAENGYYQALPNSYECKNANIDLPEELLLVKGMTPTIFLAIRDYITIFGNGKVNINTASYNVMVALGMTPSLANKIIASRAGADEVEGTEDDTVFTQATSQAIRAVTSGRQAITAEEGRSLDQASRFLGVASNFFRISSIGVLNNQTGLNKNSTKITCIINRNGKIVYWQEGVGESQNTVTQSAENTEPAAK